jgi:hypothetical protein
MTFGNAELILREAFVGEKQTDFFSTTSLIARLIEASIEIAAAFKFPQDIASIAVPAGASEFNVPNDMLSAEIGQLMLGTYRGRPSDWVTVQAKRQQLSAGSLDVYNWDSRRPGVIRFAPIANVNVTANFEYTKRLYVNAGTYVAPGANSEIWGTILQTGNWVTPLYPQFHYVVIHRAAIRAFLMSGEDKKVEFHKGLYSDELMAFGATLNMTDIANLLIERANRNDLGTGVN